MSKKIVQGALMSCKNLVFSILTLALAQAAPCSALFLLDSVMDKETQKQTGVINLTTNQRIALENWLNQNFELKQPQEEKVKESQLFLSINIDAGRKLQLSDGSTWEVAPTDVAQASVWITPFPIRITQSSDLNYPYLIVNKISGISIKVRPATAADQTAPQSNPAVPSPGATAPQSNQGASPTGTSPSQNTPSSPTGMSAPQANPRSKAGPPAQSGY